MKLDASDSSGYHEPVPGYAGHEDRMWGWDSDVDAFGVPVHAINLIWAQAMDDQGRKGAIGFQGGIPWHLPEDMRHFKVLTISHPVIMGRKTWESLGTRAQPLPNRDNIVVSHDDGYRAPGATVVGSLEEAIELAGQESIPDDGIERSEIWIIGGSGLFAEALPTAHRVYATEIDVRVSADTYAPDMSALVHSGRWRIVMRTPWRRPKRAGGVARYRFVTYERRA